MDFIPFPISRPSSGSCDSLNELKFGQKIYFEDADMVISDISGSGSSNDSGNGSPRAPLKKMRGISQTAHPPRCQVEGCKIDLSGAKAYYSRHKVCVMHSKSPMVIVAGMQQRFCQQCSRFHQLPEFDQDKRSCRRRLAGHNQRRRKPHPAPIFSQLHSPFPLPVFECSGGPGRFVLDFTPSHGFHGKSSCKQMFGFPVQEIESGGRYIMWQSGPQGHLGQSSAGNGAPARARSLLSSHPVGSRDQSLDFGLNASVEAQEASMNLAMNQFPNIANIAMLPVSQSVDSGFNLGFNLGQQNERPSSPLVHGKACDPSWHLDWAV